MTSNDTTPTNDRVPTADAVDVVRRYYAAINARDWSGYDGLFTADTELAAPGTEEDGFLRLRGVDAVRGFDQIWATASDDFTVEPLETVADAHGSVVLSRNRISMTHTGTLHTPMGDVPATGARIDTTTSAPSTCTTGGSSASRSTTTSWRWRCSWGCCRRPPERASSAGIVSGRREAPRGRGPRRRGRGRR